MRKTLSLVTFAIGCGTGAPTNPGPTPDPSGIKLPAEQQRSGDPAKGRDALLNNGYVTCGLPYSAYMAFFGAAKPEDKLPDRTGRNENIPYNFTALTTPGGVEVVAPNCLTCHAGRIGTELVVGLGNTNADYTVNQTPLFTMAKQFGPALLSDPREIAELNKVADRFIAIGPYVVTDTLGVNPADNLAAALFAHRDPATLAWSDTPLIEPPPTEAVPVDVPPWWRMKKKNAMFYSAAGRGDHARIEMAAANLCTDTVAEAMQIDSYFGDVSAYIRSLEPPKWPYAIDATLAEEGHAVFDGTCARCHGSYGKDGVYLNLVIPLDVIGTDPELSGGSQQFAERFLAWWRASFYGTTARLEPQAGYVSPPLDGIWATAPYLHNGSVPTIAALLESGTRPTYWTRSFDATDYDEAALGWRFTVVDHGKEGESDAEAKKRLYDTTRPGYTNGGHTFGDKLSAEDRRAVLEYLKTL